MKPQASSVASAAQLVGRSPKLASLRHRLLKTAPTRATVLLTGETGTGKGRVARVIHRLSERRDRPFVHVDCAALSGNLIESELFGHEKGAFTSADVRRIGRLELAANGTLFLDEIGDLEPRLQAKLLRVLEDRQYERVGGTATLDLEARILAATSRDLASAVQRGSFRADLFYRLSVLPIALPPLRERPEDLEMLLAHALDRAAEAFALPPPTLTPEAIDRLRTHTWPGNIRELMNLGERLVAEHSGENVDAPGVACLTQPSLQWNEGHRDQSGAFQETAVRERGKSGSSLLRELERLERQEVVDALDRAHGNVSSAARRLKIPRSTLRYRLIKYGVMNRGDPSDDGVSSGSALEPPSVASPALTKDSSTHFDEPWPPPDRLDAPDGKVPVRIRNGS